MVDESQDPEDLLLGLDLGARHVVGADGYSRLLEHQSSSDYPSAFAEPLGCLPLPALPVHHGPESEQHAPRATLAYNEAQPQWARRLVTLSRQIAPRQPSGLHYQAIAGYRGAPTLAACGAPRLQRVITIGAGARNPVWRRIR